MDRPGWQLNLTIWQRGLLLVCVPLICSLVFLSLLLFLLRQAEYEALCESQSRTTVSKVDHILTRLFDAGQALGSYAVLKSPVFLSRYEKISQELLQELSVLRDLGITNPRQQGNLARVEKLTGQGLGFLDKARQSMETDDRVMILSHARSLGVQLKAVLDELGATVKAISDQEAQAQASNMLLGRQARQVLMYVIYAGFAATILVALAMASLFYRGIVERLVCLVDNTRRLAAHQKLLPIVSGSDEISHLDASFHDMADSLELARQKERQFLSMVSHDLRTPLTSVVMSHELLLEGCCGELPPPAVTQIDSASRTATRLIGLVNDLLSVEKIEAGELDVEPKNVPVQELFSAAKDTTSMFARANGVNIAIGAGDLTAYADADRIHQVLVNLIGNAVKFSPQGSTITLSAAPVAAGVELRVTDQGRGIPQELTEKIFERFQQVEKDDNRKKGGAGLGLSICKAIVEAHQGTIGVRSELGKGSTFWFYLPASQKA